jgi:hypothetical protein
LLVWGGPMWVWMHRQGEPTTWCPHKHGKFQGLWFKPMPPWSMCPSIWTPSIPKLTCNIKASCFIPFLTSAHVVSLLPNYSNMTINESNGIGFKVEVGLYFKQDGCIPCFDWSSVSLFHLLVLLLLQAFYFLAKWTWSNTHIAHE